VSVRLDCVLNCSADEFILTVCRDCDRAFGLAGELPAINVLAAHVGLLNIDERPYPSFCVGPTTRR